MAYGNVKVAAKQVGAKELSALRMMAPRLANNVERDPNFGKHAVVQAALCHGGYRGEVIDRSRGFAL